jgi:hypothetical protein
MLRNPSSKFEAWEVVQVYATLPPRPGAEDDEHNTRAKKLVFFQRYKVSTGRGGLRAVKIDLMLGPLRVLHQGQWTLLPGEYTFHVGTSVRNIKAIVKALL